VAIALIMTQGSGDLGQAHLDHLETDKIEISRDPFLLHRMKAYVGPSSC